jgi:hypothetical protein
VADADGSRSMSTLARRIARLGRRFPELRAVEGMTDAELTTVVRAGLGKLAAPILSELGRASLIADILGRAVKRKDTEGTTHHG